MNWRASREKTPIPWGMSRQVASARTRVALAMHDQDAQHQRGQHPRARIALPDFAGRSCPGIEIARDRAVPTFKTILCPVDFSSSSQHALTVATELASSFDASLMIVHVWQLPTLGTPEVPISEDVIQAFADDAQRMLAEVTANAIAAGVKRTQSKLIAGVPWNGMRPARHRLRVGPDRDGHPRQDGPQARPHRLGCREGRSSRSVRGARPALSHSSVRTTNTLRSA